MIELFKVQNYRGEEEAPMVKHIEEMKDNFNNNYRDKLEKLLFKLNSPKYDSYENMLGMVDEVYSELEKGNDFENFMQNEKSFEKLTKTLQKAKKFKKPN